MHAIREEPAVAPAPTMATPSTEAGARHICIVIAALGAGGAERVIAWLAQHWLNRGARVTILSFDSPGDPIYHAMPGGARLVRLDVAARGGRSRLLPPAVRRVLTLRRALSGARPDVVVSFLTKINVLTLAATIGTRVPIVVAERNNPQRQPVHRLWTMALERLYPRADAIMCQTRASICCIPERCRDKVRVVPNPVTAPALARSVEPGRRRIAGVGRLEPQKGFDLLIDAFADVAGAHPGWTLDLWGTGPDEAALRAQAEAKGVADRVRLRGLSSTPGGWIAETDIFVLASRYEGFPNVLGEAMAAGLPVIATDCAFGPSELVVDGRNGLLVRSEDRVALASALDRMLRNADLRARVAANAPEVMRTFAPARIAATWDDVLDTVIAARAAH